MTKAEKQIRQFFRAYVDPNWKNKRNAIHLSAGNSPEHNEMVCKVCCWLLEKRIPYYTEVDLIFGTTPDIIAPTHIKAIIEVMYNESIADFNKRKAKKYPLELRDEIIFIDATKEFDFMDLM